MQNRKSLAALILIAFVAVIGAVVYQTSEPNVASASRKVIVAANFPLSGELAFYGGEFRDGLSMAVADKGASLPQGTFIEFEWGDNRFSPKDAATVLQRQLQKSPTIYTSALKPQVMAVEKEVAAAGIPHLAWVLDLTPNPTGTKNNFRTWVSFKLETDVFFEYANKRKAKTVVLSYVSLPSSEAAYGKSLADRLRQELGANVVIESYNPDVGAGDYRNIAARIASHRPDLVMINGFIPHMVGLIKAMRPLGIIKEGNTMAALDMLDAAEVLSPEESEGMLVAAPPFLIDPSAEQKAWISRFERQFGRKPSHHAAFAYDAGLTIVDAAKRVNVTASSQEWLSAILQTDIEGVTGRIRYANDQSLITSLQPAIYRHGVLVPLALDR